MDWLIIIIVILIAMAVILVGFAYRTLQFDYGNDRFMMKVGKASGYTEKTYKATDGSEISYLEGPDNGEALLLIHGQMVAKEDYAKVLPELSKHFHVFAVDCYGHGKSSKNPKKYNIISIRNDLISFMHDVIRKETFLSGHSSGALISAAIAATNKEQIKGLLLEDGPFFSTEPGRFENTFSYLEFKTIHDFLLQSKVRNYTRYYLDNTYMKTLFNKDGKDNWASIVKKPFSKAIQEKSGKMPIVWYYPPEIRLNQMIFLTRNMQDGTGNYDLRFGEAFYDFSWFESFDQKKTLGEIDCPTIILHVAPSKETAPSYYDKNGVLLSAMDEKDAEKVHTSIKNSTLKSGYKSSHDIHSDLPEQFVDAIMEMKQVVER